MEGKLLEPNIKMSRKELSLLLVLLLIGFALRFYSFDRKSLWIDEIHTFTDSRDGLKRQIVFYEQNPTYLHPPLFFVLTHLFYPFHTPERDLRIIPLIFGSLSVPMIYGLAKQFGVSLGLPTALMLTFMTYHISISQDGRSYSLAMFVSMAATYLLMKHIETGRRIYLAPVAFLYAVLFYTSYSSILFIVFSQLLWFYRTGPSQKPPSIKTFVALCGATLALTLPWILFITTNYQGQPIIPDLQAKVAPSLIGMLYGVFHDWTPFLPLTIVSMVLLCLLPLGSHQRRGSIVLMSIFFLPVVGLYFFCRIFAFTHFITSRYLIGFLPFFLISLSLSLSILESRFKGILTRVRIKPLFILLFLASNLILLPFYYRGEKEDFRRLVKYLKTHLREGDKIFDFSFDYTPGILHYFGIPPDDRHYKIPFWKLPTGDLEYRKSFVYQGKVFTIYHSKTCCTQYVADGSRLWIVVGKKGAKLIREKLALPLMGYFDGSFLNFSKFPEDASIYLFLGDPKSPDEKGIDMAIE